MSMSGTRQRGSSVQRVVLTDGQVRWRFRLDLDAGPDGKRRQQTVTCKSEAEAIARQAAGRTELARGVYVEPDKRTVNDVLDAWVLAKSVRWKPSTEYVNVSALRPVREALGARRVQQLRREDVDRLVHTLHTEGGRGGGGRSP
jgi:hypothetical protein